MFSHVLPPFQRRLAAVQLVSVIDNWQTSTREPAGKHRGRASSPSAGSMLCQRRRRWHNIVPALGARPGSWQVITGRRTEPVCRN